MSKTVLSLVAVVFGLACIGIAIFYWMTPAGNLPAYFPGYVDGSTTIHVKHGIAAFLLGLAAFAYAWFSFGKRS